MTLTPLVYCAPLKCAVEGNSYLLSTPTGQHNTTPQTFTLQCLWLKVWISYVQSNQKQSVVRRCSNMLAHTFTALFQQVRRECCLRSIFRQNIGTEQALASTMRWNRVQRYKIFSYPFYKFTKNNKRWEIFMESEGWRLEVCRMRRCVFFLFCCSRVIPLRGCYHWTRRHEGTKGYAYKTSSSCLRVFVFNDKIR